MGTAIAFALKNWQAIVGGVVALALSIALGITRHTLANRTDQRDKAVASFNLELAKNAVNLDSISQLQSLVTQQNAAIDKLNADSNAKIKAGADALAAVKQGREGTESAVAALQASAGRNIPADAPCVSSAAFRAVGKDL